MQRTSKPPGDGKRPVCRWRSGVLINMQSPASQTISTSLPIPVHERRISMGILMCATILAALDTTIANTALPQIAVSLRTSEAAIIWVANAYQIALIALVLPFAALAESIGYKRIFAGGLTLFAVASAICGEASTLSMLVVGRSLQGHGAAAMFSVSVAVIRHIYPPQMLGRGLGLNAMFVAVGFTLGPVIASTILAIASWHWLFLVNIPFAIPAILLALRYVPVGIQTSRRFEYGPAILCTAVLGLFTLGFCLFGHDGEMFQAVLSLGFAALCLTALLRLQRNHPAPILAIDLLRNRLIGLSSLTSISAFATQSLALVSLPFFLQGTLGISVVQTGLLVAAWPLVVALMAPLVARLADSGRYSSGQLCSFGLLILAIGMAALAVIPADASEIAISVRLAICGLGFGLFQAPNMREIMSNAPANRRGSASGIVVISRLMGQTMGAAMVAQSFHWWLNGGPVMSLWIGAG